MVNGKNEKVADFFRTLVSMRTYGNSAESLGQRRNQIVSISRLP
jgi:hypothetical protein